MTLHLSKLFWGVLLVILFGSCQKNDPIPPSNNPVNNNSDSTCNYFAYTTGSTFNYSMPNGTIMETVLGDTVINGVTCKKVLHNTTDNGLSQSTLLFPSCSNGVYSYKNFFIPSLNIVIDELIYLRENVSPGTQWSNSFFNATGTSIEYRYSYAGEEPSKTINNKTFLNVKVVNLSIYANYSGTPVFVGSSTSFYAEGVGLIQNTSSNSNIYITSYNIL